MKNNMFLFLLIFPMTLFCQGIDWVKDFGGTSNDEGKSIFIDKTGNVYSTGTFRLVTDFDPNSGVENYTAAGESDIYIQKIDYQGNLIWIKTIGGSGNDIGRSIVVDDKDNVYVTGYFENLVDFDPSDNTSYLNSNGNEDVFILKLNKDGVFLWANSMGGPSFDSGASLVIDGDGNIYTTGLFQQTADLDPTINVDLRHSNGGSDFYIQKLDDDGNVAWTKSMGGGSTDIPLKLDVDDEGFVYTIGYFYDTVDFDPNQAIKNLVSNGNADVFILKLDFKGNFIWAKSYGGSQYDIGHGISINQNGVYVTGFFKGQVDFDPNNGFFNLVSNGNSDIFIQKLDFNGNFLWAKNIGGEEEDKGRYIQTDSDGSVFMTGYFRSVVDFDVSDETLFLSSEGNSDVFVSKFDSEGNSIWTTTMGGLGFDEGFYLSIDAAKNIYTTGYYNDIVDIETNSGEVILESNGVKDVFIQKISNRLNVIKNVSISKLVLHPNPSTGVVNIEVPLLRKDQEVLVYNNSGKLVFKSIITNNNEINISHLPKGIYYFELKINEFEKQTGKLVLLR